MFCQKCGTSMADTATACPSCNTPVATTAAAGGGVAKVKGTAGDAWKTFKGFIGNPVGGLAPSYEALGDGKALGVGIVYGVVSLICFFFGVALLSPFSFGDAFESFGVGGTIKLFLYSMIPFFCSALCAAAVRKIAGGQGGLGGDSFMAGAALLPPSLAVLINGFLGPREHDVGMIIGVFAGCFAVLMLFAGLTRISKVSDRAASLGVPAILVITAYLSYRVLMSVLFSY